VSIYIDADAVVRWEKGEFDLPGWLEAHHDEPAAFPATVWQQLLFGLFAWPDQRANKRARTLLGLGALSIVPFGRSHAARAAKLAGEMRLQSIGFADFQIAATALVDNAELLTFNRQHFGRVPGLRLAALSPPQPE
jgi:predicted nucleic acid-binding protein